MSADELDTDYWRRQSRRWERRSHGNRARVVTLDAALRSTIAQLDALAETLDALLDGDQDPEPTTTTEGRNP